MTTARPRYKLVGVLLAASMTLQSSLVAYAAGSDAITANEAPTIAYASAPDVSRFNSLEEAVGLKQSEASDVGSSILMFAPASRDDNDDDRLSSMPQLKSIGNTQFDNGSGHFVDLSNMAAGFVPAGTNLLERADLLASAAPISAPAPIVLNATITNDPVVAKSRIDDLTRQILLKIVELERFNLHYKQEVAKQGRWKGWRYGGLQEVNNGLNLAGLIVSTGERGSHLHMQGKHIAGSIHTSVQQNANILALVGSSIGALAALNEAGINELHELQARHHGFSPGAARAHVKSIRSDIDRMLAERTANAAVERTATNLQGHAIVDDAEGKVLVDLRDQGLLEFERFHIAARKLLAFQQTQYFFDFAKYSTSAIGYEFAFLTLHKHHRYWNLRAGVLLEVSGAITMFGPIVSRYVAKGVGEAHKHYLHGTIQEAEAAKVEDLVADKTTLDNLCHGTQAPEDAATAVSRAYIYGDQSKVFQDELASSTKSRSKAKLAATQNIGAGLFVGSCKVASGVLFNVVGGNVHYRDTTNRAGRVTNASLFTASVVGLPATTFSMLDTLRIQVQGEINHHKLQESGLLPQQLIATRLAQLDDIEHRLNGLAPKAQ